MFSTKHTVNDNRTRLVWLSLLLGCALLMTSIIAVAVAPGQALAADPSTSQPTYDWATVDGITTEWDLSGDFFANMYQAADPSKDILSKLYLRYDCKNKILYALVLAASGYVIDGDTAADNHYIKLGDKPAIKLVDANDSPPNGTPPDFAFIGLSGNTAQGWEASAKLEPPSQPYTYTNLNVHTQIDNEQTSAVQDRAIQLVINCPCEGALANLDTFVTNSTNSPAGQITVTVTIYHDNPTFSVLDVVIDTLLDSQTHAIDPWDTQPFDFAAYPPGHYAVDVKLVGGPVGTSISPASPVFHTPGSCPGGAAAFDAGNTPTAVTLVSFDVVVARGGGAPVAVPLALAGVTLIAVGGLRVRRRKA